VIKRESKPDRARQTGMVTLAVGLLLMLGSSILALGVARLALMEQRIANNELRAKEVHHAAQGGLDFAFDWLSAAPSSSAASLPTPPAIAGSGDYRYLTRLAATPDVDCVRVTAEAQAANDPSIRAVVSECVRQTSLLNESFAAHLPPLVVNGCLEKIKGTPDIFPSRCDPVTQSDCEPLAIASSQPDACLNAGHFQLNGGLVRGEAFSGSAWDYLFAISKDEMRARAAEEDSNIDWITTAKNWTLPPSSASDPVILIFASSAGCPKINGNPTIYGILYFEDPGGCGSPGWGGADIYGVVAFEAPLEQFTANPDLHHWSLAGDDAERAPLGPVGATLRIPGRWRDWE
jgi:Tfp pilus assembly protein PilX